MIKSEKYQLVNYQIKIGEANIIDVLEKFRENNVELKKVKTIYGIRSRLLYGRN